METLQTGEQIDLERLRRLRKRAEFLSQSLVQDLREFRHKSPTSGFVRTPTSERLTGDFNVTTTCSCLMALALTGNLRALYKDNPPETLDATFKELLTAPWMSSGLSENNAFTTTLVLRTLGFLLEKGAIRPESPTATETKQWEPNLVVTDFSRLASKLTSKEPPLGSVLYDAMAIGVQAKLTRPMADRGTKAKVAGEIRRLVRSAVLYDKDRFAKSNLTEYTQSFADNHQSQYSTARLNRLLLNDLFADVIAPTKPYTLREIAKNLAEDIQHFQINDYPPTAAVIYWFIDAVHRARISLSKTEWEALCGWAAQEFAHQQSLVVAGHAAMMDPVAMAMAACLCARLRWISSGANDDDWLGMEGAHQKLLPTFLELEQSIIILFAHQTDSGIWPKYFPLFHYQEAGSNFCFTFELLEAVLTEFGKKSNGLVARELFVRGLEFAVTWCERNRLTYLSRDGEHRKYQGWNSGGALQTLKDDQPESWATAVVHMFLAELVEVLSWYIQERLLDQYEAISPQSPKLEELLDIDLWINGSRGTVTQEIKRSLVTGFDPFKGPKAKHLRERPPTTGGRVSALLFGPPGTSKTDIAKAIAAELDWPLVQIDPSHFLKAGYQSIYTQAEGVFHDLDDLAGVVILFDEMDALVQNRNDAKAPPDTESKFLTTFMLPKLVRLHDSRRVIFLMATNFQENFDEAIKRAGRFDLLICMGPPTLEAKCASLHPFYGKNERRTEEFEKAGKRFLDLCNEAKPSVRQQLELYTFGEFKSLINELSPTKEDLCGQIAALDKDSLEGRIEADATTVSLRLDQATEIQAALGTRSFYDVDPQVLASHAPSTTEQPTMIQRFVRDRAQSKRQ